jgi:hypothetical protein
VKDFDLLKQYASAFNVERQLGTATTAQIAGLRAVEKGAREELAAWLNEEYKRMAAWPHKRGDEALVRAGYMAALAEIESICKSGALPQHCPCREEWLMKQSKIAKEADAMFSWAVERAKEGE